MVQMTESALPASSPLLSRAKPLKGGGLGEGSADLNSQFLTKTSKTRGTSSQNGQNHAQALFPTGTRWGAFKKESRRRPKRRVKMPKLSDVSRVFATFAPLIFLVFYNGFCTVRENKVSHFNKNGKNALDIRTVWTCSFSLLRTSVFLSLFHALPPLSCTLSSSPKTAKTLGTFEKNVPPCLQSPPRPST